MKELVLEFQSKIHKIFHTGNANKIKGAIVIDLLSNCLKLFIKKYVVQ